MGGPAGRGRQHRTMRRWWTRGCTSERLARGGFQQEPNLNQPWKEISLSFKMSPEEEGGHPRQQGRAREEFGEHELSRGAESVEGEGKRRQESTAVQSEGWGMSHLDSPLALEHNSTPEPQTSHPQEGVISLR